MGIRGQHEWNENCKNRHVWIVVVLPLGSQSPEQILAQILVTCAINTSGFQIVQEIMTLICEGNP